MDKVPDGVFKPKPTTGETKSDATSRAAQRIADSETAAREAKTERLRLLRLAQESIEPALTPSESKPRATKTKA